MTNNDLISLSASRIKTFEKCTWTYYCNYILRLPSSTNDGAKRGNVVHTLFEYLLNKKHIKHFQDITKHKSLVQNPTILRFVKKQMKKEDLTNVVDNKGNNNFDLISEMAVAGLMFDFYCDGSDELEDPETSFEYVDGDGRYKITGFIDKLARYDKSFGIFDYKTSAEDGEDHSLQAKMYALYALRVRKAASFVKFLFLRFGEDSIKKYEFSAIELEEFEEYLEGLNQQLQGFDAKKGQLNMAANQPQPGKNDGFKGPLCCGRAWYPGQLKKDGNLMFHCPYKFAYVYYALVNENDEVVKTSLNKEAFSGEQKEGYAVLRKKYRGCPAFAHYKANKEFM